MKIDDKFMSSPEPNLSPSLIVRGLRVTTKDGSGSSKSMSQQSLYILAFDVQSNEIVCRSGARIVVCISVF